jgi:hypothetical protein
LTLLEKISSIGAFNQEHQTNNKTKMKVTTPLPDTEHSLFYSAINALRIAGQEKLADDLDQRMENLIKTPKVAIYVRGGIVEGVRSNLGTDLEVEIVDQDNEPDEAEDRWEELQNKLEFGNY